MHFCEHTAKTLDGLGPLCAPLFVCSHIHDSESSLAFVHIAVVRGI